MIYFWPDGPLKPRPSFLQRQLIRNSILEMRIFIDTPDPSTSTSFERRQNFVAFFYAGIVALKTKVSPGICNSFMLLGAAIHLLIDFHAALGLLFNNIHPETLAFKVQF